MVEARGRGDGDRRRALRNGALFAAAVWFAVIAVWNEGPFALTFDDAYYYFGIARNVVDGHGSTFDRINLTNGYHPLWMAVCVIPYALGLDDLMAARVLLLVQIVAWAVTTAIVAAIISDSDDAAALPTRRPPAELRKLVTTVLTAVLVLSVGNPYVIKSAVNGLESGLVVLIHAVILLRVTRQFRRTADASLLDASARWRWGTGVLLALAFLARTDAGLLGIALGLWWLADAFVAFRRHRPAGPLLTAGAELLAPTAVVGVLFLAVNNEVFGTPWQISGVVKRAPLDAGIALAFFTFLVAAVAIGRHGWKRTHGVGARRRARFPRAGSFAMNTAWYAGFSLVLIAYYNFLQTQQWLWYYAPIVLYLVILFVLAVADILAVAITPEADAEPLTEQAARRRILLVGGLIFVVPLLAGLVFQSLAFTDPTIRSIQLANRDAGVWIRDNVGDDVVLASWDAGVVGYFSHRRIVNIDGVVNSRQFHDAVTSGRSGAFLRCERVAAVVNHGEVVDGGDPDIVTLIERLYGPGSLAEPAIVHRVPFRYSGASTESGLELSGEREMVVHVYRVDPARVAPRPDDACE